MSVVGREWKVCVFQCEARPSMVGGALIGSGDALGNFEMAPPKDEKGGGCCIIA